MTDAARLTRLTPLITEAASVESEADLGQMLRTLVSEVKVATGAPYVALGVLGDHRVLSDFIYEGIAEDEAARIGHLPTGRGVLGTVIRENETIVLDSISDHPDSIGFPANHPPMNAFLGVPVSVPGDTFGNLYLTDKAGGFTDDDVAIVQALARIAGAAIQTARLNTRLRHVAIVEDRHRIARDLHDSVIQDIFSVGLGLQALSTRVEDSDVRSFLDSSIDTLDESVNKLRRYIFELRDTAVPTVGLDVRIQALVARMGSAYPARVELTVEPTISYEAEDELMLLVTEALSNALRHARARNVAVMLELEGSEMVLRVSDDGQGFDSTVAHDEGMGLSSMRTRALGLGGDMTIESRPGEGTTVVVRLPFSQPSQRH